jgi:hypothetical protein
MNGVDVGVGGVGVAVGGILVSVAGGLSGISTSSDGCRSAFVGVDSGVSRITAVDVGVSTSGWTIVCTGVVGGNNPSLLTLDGNSCVSSSPTHPAKMRSDTKIQGRIIL